MESGLESKSCLESELESELDSESESEVAKRRVVSWAARNAVTSSGFLAAKLPGNLMPLDLSRKRREA